jgi:hypothetical protein
MSETKTPSLPELLETPQEGLYKRRRRRRRSRRYRWAKKLSRYLKRYNWRIMVLLAASVISVIVMSGLLLAVTAQNQVNESWDRLDRVWRTLGNKSGTELTLSDFERLRSAVLDLRRSLANARTQTVFLRYVAFLDADLDVSVRMLDAAIQLTAAASDILTGMEPALFFLSEGEQEESVVTQISSGERAVELLRLGQGQFLSADRKLAQAGRIISQFDLDHISPDLFVTVEGLIDYHRQLQEMNQVLLDSSELLTTALGLDATRTYLILSQNSDELRPSGGYISTYGWMTVRNGRILDYDYSPSTASSPNPPPVDLSSEVTVPDWWIRYQPTIYAAWDGSWYADFPSTAAMAAWYYDRGDNPQSPVDGVISIDIVGFEYLLEMLGSVMVPGYDIVVTPENFRAEVYRIRAEGGGDRPHKQFVAALYRQIIEDWQSVAQDQASNMRGAALRALQEKHIMIYFTDTRLNAALDELGWSGQQKSGQSNDYLLVADANLGNKANRSVIRQFTYDVDIQPDGSLKNQLAVGYDYSARVAEQDPAVAPEHGPLDYNSLLQVYVPASSVLTGTSNLDFEPTTVSTVDQTIFVARVGIGYNQSQRYQFMYVTPPLIETVGSYSRYKLELQKQPGTSGDAINVQITLPMGAKVVDVSPKPVASYSLERPILEFQVQLLSDQTIEIIYSDRR